jgi:hypothetical protein
MDSSIVSDILKQQPPAVACSAGLGVVEPDPIGQLLETGYSRFVSPLGVSGLAKEEGKRVDLLAVVSHEEGKGHFGNFLRHCQETYETVCVWEDWNPILAPMLAKRGFCRASETDKFGELLTGWRWDKTPNNPDQRPGRE